MPSENTPKIQPWKALSSLEEADNPDLSERNLRANSPGGGSGASVSKPVDRDTKADQYKHQE
ncbi:hypothetical protein EJ05DRAFT_480617 [Pseudovirgaria hyperparasitica]|uniref:Uncharacterized protein n=1 Tax=Pseudovirgaria hyperparasitica TaxID=470096 RepID=A0A6A6VV01_9PEZI|nr:uncharacterized protein EJ05DRAFT_480617 [Pseudovirgaria hyperparasitica]KAF2753097.1 hypothetical protein EJ05DRAFT_480617 [Pseudovirgaria hyperparasitica]